MNKYLKYFSGWSSWSEWSSCIHQLSTEQDSHDECLCRIRHCNNPKPKDGGLICLGPAISVTNCTIHGGWTAWSAWSECSATCSYAVKTRTRTCTNPSPAHGGRLCIGQDRAEVMCTDIPPCPILSSVPKNGGWGSWTEWSHCSVSCGEGYIHRTRICDNPPPMYGGLNCSGSNIEYKNCFKVCSEQKKATLWTEWLITNNTNSDNGYIQKRFKFICKAPVTNIQDIKLNIKEEDRACNGMYCSIETAHWSRWSPWSPCSVTCGTGYQYRIRICEGSREHCIGSNTQKMLCSLDPCPSQWDCWNNWTACSVTCGWGTRKRYRNCLGESCRGSLYEEEPCEQLPCDCKY